MNRNPINPTGRYRSLMVGADYNRTDAAPTEIFTTAAIFGLITPSIVRVGGISPTWNWGDGNSDTGDSVSHNYGGSGSYVVTWNAWPGSVTEINFASEYLTSLKTSESWVNLSVASFFNNNLTSLDTFATWTKLTYFYCYVNSLTSLDTFDTWTNLERFSCYVNSLTSLDTFDTWTHIQNFRCYANSLTNLDTFDTWTELESLYCYDNSLTSLDTFDTWTNLEKLVCQENSLTSLEAFDTWVNLESLICLSNQLPASEIDNILINIDATGQADGTLRYENNPGSADVDRSAAAATAKADLITKGWFITN